MHVMIVYDCASLYGCLPAMQLPMIIHLLFTDIFLSESPLQPPPLPAPTSACVAAKEIQARWESIRDSYTEDCRKVKSEIASGATPSSSSSPSSAMLSGAGRLPAASLTPRARTRRRARRRRP